MSSPLGLQEVIFKKDPHSQVILPTAIAIFTPVLEAV